MDNLNQLTPLRKVTNDEAYAILSTAGLIPDQGVRAKEQILDGLRQDPCGDNLIGIFTKIYARRLSSGFKNPDHLPISQAAKDWYGKWVNSPPGALTELETMVVESLRLKIRLQTLSQNIGVDAAAMFLENLNKWIAGSPKRAEWIRHLAEETTAEMALIPASFPPVANKQQEEEVQAPAFSSPEVQAEPVNATAEKPLAADVPATDVSKLLDPPSSGKETSGKVEKDSLSKTQPAPEALTAQQNEAVNVQPAPPPPPPPPPSPPPPAPLWKYFSLPEEPDMHSEYDVRSTTTPDGKIVIGARVRGKKHKHEGTHCDDWFEFQQVGDWTIMAVSDGGGSYKFSRIGARAACTGAVQYLVKALAECKFSPRDQITTNIAQDESFIQAQKALHGGMKAAWDAIQKAFVQRADDARYLRLLPNRRDMTLKDLYSTLLVSIRVRIETKDGPRSLVFGCAGGDGMIAVISKDGAVKLLMEADSGAYSSEVKFFDEETISTLESRTYPFAGSARAVMLMTDGVSDDYYPNEKSMGELYADLVINGILPLEKVDAEAISSELKSTKIQDLKGIKELDFLVEVERLLKEPVKVKLASAKKYAEALGVEPTELAKRPALLAAASLAANQPMQDIKGPEDRLLVWLDSYYVRSSFDDRTILVMADGGK